MDLVDMLVFNNDTFPLGLAEWCGVLGGLDDEFASFVADVPVSAFQAGPGPVFHFDAGCVPGLEPVVRPAAEVLDPERLCVTCQDNEVAPGLMDPSLQLLFRITDWLVGRHDVFEAAMLLPVPPLDVRPLADRRRRGEALRFLLDASVSFEDLHRLIVAELPAQEPEADLALLGLDVPAVRAFAAAWTQLVARSRAALADGDPTEELLSNSVCFAKHRTLAPRLCNSLFSETVWVPPALESALVDLARVGRDTLASAVMQARSGPVTLDDLGVDFDTHWTGKIPAVAVHDSSAFDHPLSWARAEWVSAVQSRLDEIGDFVRFITDADTSGPLFICAGVDPDADDRQLNRPECPDVEGPWPRFSGPGPEIVVAPAVIARAFALSDLFQVSNLVLAPDADTAGFVEFLGPLWAKVPNRDPVNFDVQRFLDDAVDTVLSILEMPTVSADLFDGFRVKDVELVSFVSLPPSFDPPVPVSRP